MRSRAGIVVVVLLGTTWVGLAPSSVAGAAQVGTRPVHCKTLGADYFTGGGTVSGCAPGRATGGSGSVSSLNSTGGQVTWATATTTAWRWTVTGPPNSVDETERASGSCPVGVSEFELRGSVSASTNPKIVVGESVSAELCVHPRAFETNEPRSKL